MFGIILGERIGVIGMTTFYENLGFKGFIKKEEYSMWAKEVREKINAVKESMKNDLISTF